MPEPSPSSGELAPATPNVNSTRRRWWQFGITTLFLVTTVIAVWFSHFLNLREIALLETRIKSTRPLAHELIIEDVNKVAAVKLDEVWNNDDRWNIYLPDGNYQLCLATRGVAEKGLASLAKKVPISAGKHRIMLNQETISAKADSGWRLTVESDGTPLVTVDESAEWGASGSSMGGGAFGSCSQVEPEKPIILYRRRFGQNNGTGQWNTPAGPTEGILLWIERVPGNEE